MNTCHGTAPTPDPDVRPLHPVTGEELPYHLTPFVDHLAEAELTNDQRWEWIDSLARIRT